MTKRDETNEIISIIVLILFILMLVFAGHKIGNFIYWFFVALPVLIIILGLFACVAIISLGIYMVVKAILKIKNDKIS